MLAVQGECLHDLTRNDIGGPTRTDTHCGLIRGGLLQGIPPVWCQTGAKYAANIGPFGRKRAESGFRRKAEVRRAQSNPSVWYGVATGGPGAM